MKNSESNISIETSESDNQEFKRRLINCLNSDKEGENQISIENSKNENLDFFSNKMIKEMNISSEKNSSSSSDIDLFRER
ncbi:hypothetical protein BpHYR1_031031 [Brachionus plicatilis]|uniref:Uncharacterized protein n=1 Tax=Brachionus plicatilis TaxID=10195 RepID=A0A3M7P8G7_BRAPC|nr:hypothetical protein BpHYR1_031031 [Brachionus plicatilis]